MTLAALAQLLGGSVNGDWINIPGPGHSSADRSLGFRFDPAAPDGFHLSSLAGDDLAVCRKHVKARLSGMLSCTVSSVTPAHSGASAKMKAAQHIWMNTVQAVGTPVETYLKTRRCVVGDWHEVIQFHPDCPFGPIKSPAMVAMIQNVLTGETQGVHRTALNDAGTGKRIMPAGINAKMMLGSAATGGVILAEGGPHLGIAEGIETALSAQKLFGVPVWALLSAGGIARFPIIPGIKELTIFADHDKAGREAAVACARRYTEAGIAGRIRVPPQPGQDWNDFLQATESENEQ